MELEFRPHKHQYKFLTNTQRNRAFISGIGGGKTLVGCIEALYYMNKYPGTTGAVIAPCYDDQTEILTDTGWKYFEDITYNDKVATLLEDELVYQTPKDIMRYPYSGEMIGYKSENLDLLVTPEHRCYTRLKKGNWGIKKAKEIYGKWCYQFKSTADWVGEDTGDEDWFEFLGYWFAEGHAEYNEKSRKYRVVVTTKNDTEYCKNLLKRNFDKWSKDKNGVSFSYTVYSKKLAEKLSKYGDSRTKKIPAYVKKASVRLLKKFIKGYLVGDGRHTTKCNQTGAYTASKQLADDLQEISLKTGVTTSIREYVNHSKWGFGNPIYYVGFKTNRRSSLSTNKHKWYKKDYDGMVYCVEVYGGVVLVRRNGVHYFCGNTYRMLEDTTIKTFMDACPKEFIGEYKRGEKRLIFHNGSECIFRSADEPDKLRGPNLAWFWIDEAALVSENCWKIMQGRLRIKPEKCWITSTPKGFNWIYREFIENPRRHYWHITFSTLENPYLSQSYKDSLLTGYSGAFLKQEVYGEFVAFEGLVYPNFTRNMHVVSELPEFKEYIAGCDFGFTNPSVLLVIGVDNDERLYVVEEFYQSGINQEAFCSVAKDLHGKYSFSEVYCDPSSPDYVNSLNGVGVPARGVKRGVMEGISQVTERLIEKEDGRPRLYVHERCVNTLNEFTQYKYPETKEDKPVQENPIKLFDHSMDALSYAVYGHGHRLGFHYIGSLGDAFR